MSVSVYIYLSVSLCVCHFEFMVQGDLHEYLYIVHLPHSDISLVDKNRIGGGKVLEYPDMVLNSTQVRFWCFVGNNFYL